MFYNSLELSNHFFEKAYIYTEDYNKSHIDKFTTFLTNPQSIDYKAEDHEVLYINYYKALNYFALGNLDAALVECKRMNIRLGQQDDKYKNEDSKSIEKTRVFETTFDSQTNSNIAFKRTHTGLI